MFYKFATLFIGASLALAAEENDFARFEEHLNSYFLHLDEVALKEKENAYGRHLAEEKENLKIAVKESHAIFHMLREKFRDILLAEYGNHPDTNSEANAMEAEVTDWYIKYVKGLLHSEVQNDENQTQR